MDEKDTLIKAWKDKGFRRRTISGLIEQTKLKESLILLTLRLNPNIWFPTQGCKGDMWEITSNAYAKFMAEAIHYSMWSMFDD